MAEYGWNMSHRNMHGLNPGGQRPYSPTRIACRLCDHVFLSTQALINHIESHMREEESARRQHRTSGLPSTRDPFVMNSFLPVNYIALPAPTGVTLPILENRLPPAGPVASSERHVLLGVDRIVASRPTLPPQSPPMARNNFSLAPRSIVPASPRQAEQPPKDCTKPYLNQLDHPIMAVVDITGSSDDHNTKSSLDINLDLALKL